MLCMLRSLSVLNQNRDEAGHIFKICCGIYISRTAAFLVVVEVDQNKFWVFSLCIF